MVSVKKERKKREVLSKNEKKFHKMAGNGPVAPKRKSKFPFFLKLPKLAGKHEISTFKRFF